MSDTGLNAWVFCTVTSKGQITIPIKIRRKLNLKPGQVLEGATLHRHELLDDWEKAKCRQELKKIAPLE